MINENNIEELCLKGESETLDYKREQYKFSNDKEKSELLKDVLALANAWRDKNAYILIGVSEKDGKGEIEGIQSNDIFDDANIQQFINSKTNKKIPFGCYTVNCKKAIVQVIEIKDCINERPFYSIKDFGNVKKDIVKIRRGTSTGDASPDETAKMGEAKIAKMQPSIESQISSAGSEEYSTKEISLHTKDVSFEKHQATSNTNDPLRNLLGIYSEISTKDKQKWMEECFSICSINLRLKNISEVQAKDLRIETKIVDASMQIEKLDDLPSKPQKGPFVAVNQNFSAKNFIHRGVNIHPQDTYEEERIMYLRPEKSGTATLIVTIYGQDLRKPLVFNFKLNFFVKKETYSLECLKERFWDYLEEDSVFKILNS
jgi:hypothetical protein